MPWKVLVDLIERHYPRSSSKGGRPPYPLETMLRIHLLQQWYDLSDPAMEDALIEMAMMRRFAGIALITDRIPDETTILAFRHLLEQNDLGEQLFEAVKKHLKANGMAMKQGTIMDATIIAAPIATKKKKRERDPEMHQTTGLIQSVLQPPWPGLSAWAEVGGIAPVPCLKPHFLQPIST